MSGWIAVKRGIHEHHLFAGRHDRLFIWTWMLANACWKDTPHDVGGKTILVKRGQLCVSLSRMAEACHVGIQSIRTFLHRLENEHMINTATNTGRTIITICNYEKYQSALSEGNTAPNAGGNTALTRDQHAKEQENNNLPSEDIRPTLSLTPVETPPDPFDAFWKAYPRKEAKPDARKAFNAAIKRTPAQTIIDGARRYGDAVDRDKTEKRFVKLAGGWIRDERWADAETDPPKPGTPEAFAANFDARRNAGDPYKRYLELKAAQR